MVKQFPTRNVRTSNPAEYVKNKHLLVPVLKVTQPQKDETQPHGLLVF